MPCSKRSLGALTLVIGLAFLAGCDAVTLDFLGASAFPDFVSYTDSSVDLSDEIRSIIEEPVQVTTTNADGESTAETEVRADPISSVAFDLAVVRSPGRTPLVLLLVEPPAIVSETQYTYRGKLIILEESGGQLTVRNSGVGPDREDDPFGFFGRPFAYAHDGNLLTGYTVLDPAGEQTNVGQVELLRGRSGFAFSTNDDTYVVSAPPGDFAGFSLNLFGFFEADWQQLFDLGAEITPPGARPPADDPNIAQLGYQLSALSYDPNLDSVNLLLSEPAEGRLHATRIALSELSSGSGVLLPDADAWPVPAGLWPVSLEVDRPAVFADQEGFFLVRRDGVLDRYSWTEDGGSLGVSTPVRIVGDRSLRRRYAFLVRDEAEGPSFMYRFDPTSQTLTRYRKWW
jgi:hypothetical protein